MRKQLRFQYGRATAKLAVWDEHHATLSNVFSVDRGKGHAHGVLQQVADYADRHGLELLLEARQYGYSDKMSPDNAGLRRFYAKYGFLSLDSDMMMRPPHDLQGS